MDRYDRATVFSSIDTHGRYAYANQPIIAHWNLTRFAETLLPIIDPDIERATQQLTATLQSFPDIYLRHWLAGMRTKLGLVTEEDGDVMLVNDLFAAMQGNNADYTLVFRRLSDAARGDLEPAKALFDDATAFELWAAQWQARLQREAADPKQRADAMDDVNPVIIPRNHKVEEALTAAVAEDDLTAFDRLLEIVRQPYVETAANADYVTPAPLDAAPHRTFCGT